MDAVERSVRSWIASEKDTEINKLVAGIASGSVTILDIVKALGEYLTSDEDHLRTKGVRILSSVIERCPKDKLNRQAVRVLTTFYCSKLEDTETITPALGGLSHLVEFPSFSPLEVTDVISAIFQHVNMRSLIQSTRFYVYNIIYALVNMHRDYLKSAGESFISGYAALASGEKDPRNLLVAFKIARVILTEFDISKHVEDYFDITFCYYPITFRPPPNDPYGISTDDLKDSLRACLTATPAFGAPGMALFLEKLSIAPSVIKRDVLQTMVICFPIYGISIAREFGRKIWSALKLEIFQPTDSLTEELALDTLRAFIRLLQEIPSDDVDNDISMVLEAIHFDSLDAVGKPEKAQAKAGIKVLCKLLDASSKLGDDAIKDGFNILTRLFHDPEERSNRAAIIVLLTDLLGAFVDFTMPEASTTTETLSTMSSLLIPHKDTILGILVVGLKSSSTRLPAIHGLSTLIRLPALLSDSELGYIVHEIREFVGRGFDEDEDVSSDTISLLSSIALNAPHHLAEQILPSLFAILPEEAPSSDAHSQRMGYWRALRALSKLCLQPTLFEILVIRLTAKLKLIHAVRAEIAAEEDEHSAAYAHALLLTLSNTFSAKVNKVQPDPDVPKYADLLLPHLLRNFIEAATSKERRIFQDQRVLHVGARIVKLVVEALSIERQQQFINRVAAAFLNGQVEAVTGGELLSLAEEFKPTHVSASTRQRETLVLFSATHVPLHKEVLVIPGTKGRAVLSQFLTHLVLWYKSSTNSTLQSMAASELFTTLVNKYTNDISDFLEYMLKSHCPSTFHDLHTPEARHKDIDILVWISRGLLVRSHSLASSFIDIYLNLLEDQLVSWDAARALGTLLVDDGVLTKRNGAVVKILHVQKCLDVILPKVIDGAKKVDGTRQETTYLIALASLINVVPKALYATQMPTLVPLLLRGLEVSNPETRWQIIDAFSKNIDTLSDGRLLSTYASALVTAMLKNCTVMDMPEHKVRVAALKHLGLLPGTVRYDVLHPYKPRVLKDLANALDDPKRAVRREAVDARTKWYLYSG